MQKIHTSLDTLIGNTPLVQLPAEGGRLLAKLEFMNPAGSVKDRAALFMIDRAEQDGLLAPGGTIIEPTSGNTGIGLAAVAAARGYKTVIVMPDTMSVERIRLMEAYGAKVVLTPGAEGMSGAVEQAKALAEKTPGSFVPLQFDNAANALAHYCTTGPELWEATEGKLDIFVAGVGTGGTLTGTGRYLKEKNHHMQVVAVEPADSPLLSGGVAGAHGIQGIGANFIPSVLDTDIYDEVRTATCKEAYAEARTLAKTQGLLVGISSGAALAVARKLCRENPGKTVAVLLPDTGQRYLSSDLFTEAP